MSAASSQPLTVCLSGPVADFVRAQVATEGFSDASEYINRLVFERQRQKALAPLEAQLLEGLDSPELEATDEFWNELDREIDAKLSESEIK